VGRARPARGGAGARLRLGADFTPGARVAGLVWDGVGADRGLGCRAFRDITGAD